ncbi:hypothetical protein B0H17DRAFT_1136662 [Mycena rosella]|uniref:Uncharacterized protein n=1 Tax=Mycena rosella TaxID=1033263 RepID=A0AAD7DAB9_MYCRO|nr:hypothetical protein B0H17DRAFT_1136662 [Mycena rosella]
MARSLKSWEVGSRDKSDLIGFGTPNQGDSIGDVILRFILTCQDPLVQPRPKRDSTPGLPTRACIEPSSFNSRRFSSLAGHFELRRRPALELVRIALGLPRLSAGTALDLGSGYFRLIRAVLGGARLSISIKRLARAASRDSRRTVAKRMGFRLSIFVQVWRRFQTLPTAAGVGLGSELRTLLALRRVASPFPYCLLAILLHLALKLNRAPRHVIDSTPIRFCLACYVLIPACGVEWRGLLAGLARARPPSAGNIHADWQFATRGWFEMTICRAESYSRVREFGNLCASHGVDVSACLAVRAQIHADWQFATRGWFEIDDLSGFAESYNRVCGFGNL